MYRSAAAAVLAMSTTVFADVKLPAIISDHMVVQANKPVAVWGWADAGEQVTVATNGQMKTATPGEGGKWIVKLDPMKPSATPTTLTITGKNTVTINDVLVGEVWLGSGQSNMAFKVQAAKDAEKEIAAANYPLMRGFMEMSNGSPTPEDVGSGKWVVCSPATAGGYSAALFFMARELHQMLGVPVGMINSSVGGTPIEAWIRGDAQRATPELSGLLDLIERTRQSREKNADGVQKKFEEQLEAWKKAAAEAKKAGKQPGRPPRNPNDVAKRKNDVGSLYNGKIHPLIPYTLAGVIWYQGEANTVADKAPYYQYQLPLLVSDWRKQWGDELPFAWVQLPNFGGPGRAIPIVREAMLKSLKLPRTGMAIAIDVGDVRNIHPTNKQAVGHRLAVWALATVYGKTGDPMGPIPNATEVKGNQFVVRYDNATGGLVAQGGPLTGFFLAGPDKQFKPAEAKIVGDLVIVTHPDIPEPAALRYAFANNPTCNLYNAAGLPATPFRTDDWPYEADK
jgi:sialate O-acetylesterase